MAGKGDTQQETPKGVKKIKNTIMNKQGILKYCLVKIKVSQNN